MENKASLEKSNIVCCLNKSIKIDETQNSVVNELDRGFIY